MHNCYGAAVFVCSHQVKDLLQSLLEAQDKIADDSATASKEIAGLAFDFLLAGYEGTSNTLSYTTHLLAMHPDVQEKLQAEIDQYFEDNPVCKPSILIE